MWQGIDLFCNQAQKLIKELPDLSEPGRWYKWQSSMKKFGHKLLMKAQAIDKFIICLEECGHVPPNYNVAAVLGDERYHNIKQMMQKAAENLKKETLDKQEMQKRYWQQWL